MLFATFIGVFGVVARQASALIVSNKAEGPFVDTLDCWRKETHGQAYRGLKTTTVSGRTCQNWAKAAPHGDSVNYLSAEQGVGNHNFCRNPQGKFGEPWCFTSDPNRPEEVCGVPACTADKRNYADEADDFKGKVGAGNLHCDCADALYGSTVTTKDTRVALAQHTVKGRLINGKCVCDQSLLATQQVRGIDTDSCYNKADKGENYIGLVTSTGSGRTCANWKDHAQQSGPHLGNHNYCRNPAEVFGATDANGNFVSIRPTKPWCFTMDPNLQFEECTQIPECSDDGKDYEQLAADLHEHMKTDDLDCKCADQLYGSAATTADTAVKPVLAQGQFNGKMINGKCHCHGSSLAQIKLPLGVQSLSDKDFDSSCYSVNGPAGTSGGAKGRSYRGLVSTSVSGRTCQKWTDNHPWAEASAFTGVGDDDSSGEFVFGNGIGNHNYCRNPDSSQARPWCFTVDPNEDHKIELCEIEACPENVRDFKEEVEDANLGADNLNCACADYLYGSTKTTKDTRIALSQQRRQQKKVGKLVNGRCLCPGDGDGDGNGGGSGGGGGGR